MGPVDVTWGPRATAWKVRKFCVVEQLALANPPFTSVDCKPLNHQVAIHYGRTTSNKSFSFTPLQALGKIMILPMDELRLMGVGA